MKNNQVKFLQKYLSGQEPFVIGSGKIVMAPKYALTFRKWKGAPPRHTFGGKMILDVSGKPRFAELAIANIFEREGFAVRWAETYGKGSRLPMFLIDWQDRPYKEQTDHPIYERWVTNTLKRIAMLNGHSYSGCWDVIAWKNNELFFIESKRCRHDRMRKSQRRWLIAGLKSGLVPENFLVIEWNVSL